MHGQGRAGAANAGATGYVASGGLMQKRYICSSPSEEIVPDVVIFPIVLKYVFSS